MPSPKRGKQYPHLWRDDVKYGALHLQVYKKYGKAKKCIHCGTEENVEWANKSNEYKNVDDFIELCSSCHKKYDNRMNGTEVWNKGKKGIYSNEVRKKMGADKIGKTPWNKKERKTIFCKCGCGKTRLNIDKAGRERDYIHGHNKGHMYGRSNLYPAQILR